MTLRLPVIQLSLMMLASPLLAQRVFLPPVHEWTDLLLGMPKEHVIAGLAERYTLKKEGAANGSEKWTVQLRNVYFGELWFKSGKLDSASRRIMTAAGGDVLYKFFEEIFDSSGESSRITEHQSGVTRSRTAIAMITSRIVSVADVSLRQIFVVIGGRQFRLQFTRDSLVDLEEFTMGALQAAKKQ